MIKRWTSSAPVTATALIPTFPDSVRICGTQMPAPVVIRTKLGDTLALGVPVVYVR